MMRFKWLFALCLIVNVACANEWNITIGKLTPEESIKLLEERPHANPDDNQSVHIRYFDEITQFFILTSTPTLVLYNELLACGKQSYLIVMLKTDNSREKASLIITSITNRLYIFDESLKLLDESESNYYKSEDDYGSFVKYKHSFTLDNVETYACQRMEDKLAVEEK